MAKRDQYAIGQATITKAAAANFLAEALSPPRERRAVSKRLHGRITQAQLKGSLPAQPAIPADVLFGWAVEEKGLEGLREIPGIPISASVAVSGVVLEGRVGKDVSGVPSPLEANELVPMYNEAVHKLEAAQREISKLTAASFAKEEKERALSLGRSESGKQGGRGNEK